MNPPGAGASRATAPHRTTPRRPPLPIVAIVLTSIATMLSAPAQAYVGPGAGLGVIGTLFGIVAALVLALFGLFWYPLKRAFGRRNAANGVPAPELPPHAVPDDAPSSGGSPVASSPDTAIDAPDGKR